MAASRHSLALGIGSLAVVASLVTPAPVPGGGLEIVSLPGAEVIWEGVSLGPTDSSGVLRVDEAPPGSYTVVLRKSGYRPLRRAVEIGTGSRTLFLTLEPISALNSRPPSPDLGLAAAPPADNAGELTAGSGGERPPATLDSETAPPVEETAAAVIDPPIPATADSQSTALPSVPAEEAGPRLGPQPAATTAAVPSPTGGESPSSPAPAGPAASRLLLVVATVLLSAALLLLLWRRRSEASAIPRTLPLLGRGLGLEGGRAPGRETGEAGFLRDLRRREEDLEGGQVIDAEVLEVSSVDAERRGGS